MKRRQNIKMTILKNPLAKAQNILLMGMIAALIGCVADVLLLYVPGIRYEADHYQFLAQISESRSLWGGYIGLFVIPLEVAVFFSLRNLLMGKDQDSVWGKILNFSILYMLVIGLCYHMGTTLIREMVVHGIFTNDFEMKFVKPLEIFTGLSFLALNISWNRMVLSQEILLSKHLAWITPAFFYIIILLIYVLFPQVGSPLMVAGFNLAFFLFFFSIRLDLKNGQRKFN